MTRSRARSLPLLLPLLLGCSYARRPAELPVARMTTDSGQSPAFMSAEPAKAGAGVTTAPSAVVSGARTTGTSAAVARTPRAPGTGVAPSASGALKGVAGPVLAAMDSSANPCEDFYRFACGNWLDTTTRPPDRERWGRGFSEITERNLEVERQILEDAARSRSSDPALAKIGRFYTACMDEAAVERAGARPLSPLLQKIDGVRSADEAFRLGAELHQLNVPVFFEFSVSPDFKDPNLNIAHVWQGGLALPDRDYYLKTEEDSAAIRKDYVAHVARMLELAGVGPAAAKEQAGAVLAFETELARVSLPREELRDPDKTYNKVDLEGLEKMTPALPWRAFLARAGYPDAKDISVAVPAFYKGLDAIVPATSPETLRAYLRWHLAHVLAPSLSKAFVDENFEFFGKRIRGAKEQLPRWKRCVGAVDDALGEVLGKVYVESRFPGESKTIALEMIKRIEDSFERGLPELAWMDAGTRLRAVEKMKAITNKIGYPDRWRDYSGLEVGDSSHFQNSVASRKFQFDFHMKKVGKPVDRGEWGMTPPTVNAYYNPSVNEIVFPAGIMQPPFFDRRFPEAMNYGGIGMVMGHELTHGFDDQGLKFDGQGKLREWWGPQVSAKFYESARCIVDLYSGYEVQPGVKVNGKLTLGENIADLGGIKEAFRAYRSGLKGVGSGSDPSGVGSLTSDQLFFVAFAQTWCMLQTPEIERMLVTVDPHSPPKFRVNGPVSNLAEFGEAFSCPVGSPMRAKNACVVW